MEGVFIFVAIFLVIAFVIYFIVKEGGQSPIQRELLKLHPKEPVDEWAEGGDVSGQRYYLDERGQQRCYFCEKVVFIEDYLAISAAQMYSRNYGGYNRPYYEPRCGSWHLTTQESGSRMNVGD